MTELHQAGEPGARAAFRWPGGRSVAVVLSIAYEVWAEGHVSGVGPMGNPLPPGVFDTNADSYGRYGARTGIGRLLRLVGKVGVPVDVFTSGALAERDPAQVRAIAAAGHGIVAHGYTQDAIPAKLTPEQEAESIRLTTERLADVTGRRPSGWISPRASPGPATRDLLARAGYRWHADGLDADLPHVEHHAGRPLVSVPLGVELNDLAHAMRHGRTPRQFIEMFEDAVTHCLADADHPVVLDVLVHAHCYGRPASAWAFAEIARLCLGHDELWLTTRERIADVVLADQGESRSP
ncbi:polysaccharide deacetylase family protein [Roseomonas sp. NAR14]|uniref:Chitooligosaccharide deacetylase n=1 Tax=Roseomonas acroporae TaxID=2937791 RepID=A0A9X1Y7U9_9PROT|nr:polysaccharide deacetylase family protein [Roseomonas acroporae]MCK8783692.1 polysaccharide deacetylase family protein [Roseomonas acroporae]